MVMVVVVVVNDYCDVQFLIVAVVNDNCKVQLLTILQSFHGKFKLSIFEVLRFP